MNAHLFRGLEGNVTTIDAHVALDRPDHKIRDIIKGRAHFDTRDRRIHGSADIKVGLILSWGTKPVNTANVNG